MQRTKTDILNFLQNNPIRFYSTTQLGLIFYPDAFAAYLTVLEELTHILQEFVEDNTIKTFIRDRGDFNAIGIAETETNQYWGFLPGTEAERKKDSLDKLFQYIKENKDCTINDMSVYMFGKVISGKAKDSMEHQKLYGMLVILLREKKIVGKGQKPTRYSVSLSETLSLSEADAIEE